VQKGVLHEVADWSGGERVCVLSIMKDNVHEMSGVCPIGPWKRTTCLWLENDLEIEPHIYLFIFKLHKKLLRASKVGVTVILKSHDQVCFAKLRLPCPNYPSLKRAQ